MSRQRTKKISRRDMLFGGFRRIREAREAPDYDIRNVRRGSTDEASASEPDLPDAVSAQPSGRGGGDETAPELLSPADRACLAGDYESAVEGYREMIRENPANGAAQRRLGWCLYRDGQFIQARVAFERALRAESTDSFAALYLGLCWAQLGKPAKAAAAWKGYFNPSTINLQREVNVQLALLETDEEPDPAAAADAVEAAISESGVTPF